MAAERKKREVIKQLKNDNNKSGGISSAGLLTVAFIVLKLCHVIEWSWWWVLSPVWIMAIIVVICVLLVAAFDS